MRRLKAALLVGVAALLIGAGDSAKAEQELRFTTSVPAQSFLYADILSVWADRVTEDSNGTLTIRMFPAGTLGRDPAVHLDMVRNGVVDIAYVVPGYTPGAFPEATVIELPGIAPNSLAGSLAATQMVEDGMWTGQGMEDVIILGMFATAPTILTTTEPVEVLDDVAGLKLRGAGPQLLATIEALGATPVGGITSPQIAEALSRGLVDGTINEWVASTIFGVLDAARYHLDINLGASSLMVAINRATYEALPDEARAAIDSNSGAAFAALWGNEFDARNQAFRATALEQEDRTLTVLSEAEQPVWDARLQTTVDAWITATPNGQAIHDAFVAAIEAAQAQ